MHEEDIKKFRYQKKRKKKLNKKLLQKPAIRKSHKEEKRRRIFGFIYCAILRDSEGERRRSDLVQSQAMGGVILNVKKIHEKELFLCFYFNRQRKKQ